MRGLISRILGFVAAVKFPRFLQTFINEKYVSGFKIDMSEFKEPKEYESLTALFTRELQRPRNFDVSPQAFISPSDGTCLEHGVSKELKAISVKGHEYGIAELLGDSMERREQDAELEYVNIYLSPRDYHRYHAPCDMRILSALYVPGELYSVAVSALLKVPNLYAKNERVVLKCELANGKKMWLVFVGALNVGKMKFDFDARIQTNAYAGNVALYEYENLSAKKGEQLGMFELGSTILILSEQGAVKFDLVAEQKLKYGDKIGTIN
ncbi:phosphatidylserine decarboxylase [Campylobacter showae]|uniref:phosphatidylserine decarboxylase n=1 Tax=Campylobacter showae TaxID=204 RepID=UPI000F082F3B|nr:phosphatidylserine decarboxylase [Campylobacter showae]